MDPTIPLWVMAGSNVLQGASGFFGGPKQEGLSTADQRFMADFQMKMAARNEDFQREQYQYQKMLNENGISMRVKDAERAGIHPLVAMGGSAPGVGGGSFGVSLPAGAGSSGGGVSRGLKAMGDMGQNISRALMAQKSPEEKAMFQAQLDNERAQGDLLRAQTAEIMKRTASGPGSPPGLGRGGSGDAVTGDRLTLFREPDGTYSAQWSPEFAQSMQGRPISAYATDMKDIFRPLGDAIGNLWRGGPSRSEREYNRYMRGR